MDEKKGERRRKLAGLEGSEDGRRRGGLYEKRAFFPIWGFA
jgi:hypothetical protein